MICGPKDTPYEGGFFVFYFRYPPTYPNEPPIGKFLTTDSGRVRFNPNLYKNGKICLSLLGTWSGPGWTPAHSLKSVLLSI
jgi:ubiquitin-conjugating enzyme E2 Z